MVHYVLCRPAGPRSRQAGILRWALLTIEVVLPTGILALLATLTKPLAEGEVRPLLRGAHPFGGPLEWSACDFSTVVLCRLAGPGSRQAIFAGRRDLGLVRPAFYFNTDQGHRMVWSGQKTPNITWSPMAPSELNSSPGKLKPGITRGEISGDRRNHTP